MGTVAKAELFLLLGLKMEAKLHVDREIPC